MPVVESIIRFIGLCLFTQSIQTDPGVHVLIPHIEPPLMVSTEKHTNAGHVPIEELSPAPPETGGGKRQAPPATAARPGAPPPASASGVRTFKMRGVESHLAGIAFPAASYDAINSTWTAKPLGTTGLMYVPLAGERVKFITDLPNNPASITGIKLPKLQTCCTSMAAPSFQAAQAVIDVPFGKLNACGGKVVADKRRIDTELKLSHSAPLTIRGTKGSATKEVRLKTAATIVVLNIPSRVLAGDYSVKPFTAPDGVPHQHAYYEMSGASCTTSLTACGDPAGLCDCQSCGIGVIDTPPEGKTTAVDFQCSNSQWP